MPYVCECGRSSCDHEYHKMRWVSEKKEKASQAKQHQPKHQAPSAPNAKANADVVRNLVKYAQDDVCSFRPC